MGFLGAAFAPAVWRCALSPKWRRACAILLPCVLLALASIAGFALGDVSRASPALFAAFLSFGCAALLFLVTHELLIEAAEAGGDIWWVNICVFVGILLVLELNRVLPGGNE